MLDLFGMGKKKEEESQAAPAAEPAPSPAPEPAPAPRGSHRLWAFLLVLDSVFVVVFAGAVAAKLYQHWRAPAAPMRQARRPAKEAPKPSEPAPTASSAPAAAAPVEPPKEPAKEAPKAAAKSEPAPAPSGMRPPKPSLLTDGPKPRQTPTLAGTGQAAKPAKPAEAPASDSGERPKAKPVLFSLRAPSAHSVALVGAFIVRGGRKEMSKGSDGVWSAEIYLHPGQYRYYFNVDKKKVLDPEVPRTDRGYSVLTVP